MSTETPHIPIGEAARALGVSVATLRRWESTGKITAVRTPGDQRRFPVSEIERVKAGARHEPHAGPVACHAT